MSEKILRGQGLSNTDVRRSALHAIVLACSAALIAAEPAVAATDQWTGATDASWGTAGNWTLGLPTSTDTVLFDTLSTANLATSLAGDTSILGLTIGNPAGPVSISNNTLTLGAGGIDMSAATQDLTISSNLTLAGNAGQIWNVASGRTLTLSPTTFTRSAGATLNVQGSGTVAATSGVVNTNGILGGWASVGSGTSLRYATLNGSNQIVGLTGSATFTSGTVSPTLNFDLGANVTLAGSRSANTIRSTGGNVNITLATNRNLQITSGLMNAGTGTFTVVPGGTGVLNPLSTDLTFVTNTQALNINAPITNTNFNIGNIPTSITVASPEGGTITFAGANSFTGGLAVNSGTLALNNSANNAIADACPVNVNGGTLSLGVRSDTVGAVTLNNGAINSTTGVLTGASYALQNGSVSAILGGNSGVNLTKSTAGTVTLTGTNTYAGATTINGGTLQIGNGAGGSLGAGNYAGAITNNGILAFNSTSNQTLTGGITGGGTLTKAASGTLTLSNTNALAAVNVTGGTLTVAGTTTAGNTSVGDGATLGTRVTNTAATALTLGGNSLTFGNTAAGSNFAADFNLLANPTAPLVDMSTGLLTLNGNVALSLTNTSNLTNGTFTLIDYGTLAANGFSFTQASTNLTPRTTAVVFNDAANTNIVLTVSADKPKWTGLDSANWVAGTTGPNGNWKLVNANTKTDYIQGDEVLFDDTATLNRTIDIATGDVSPALTTFTTNANDYKLTSSGGFGITGTGPLVKNGSGTVTVTTANTYTGSTTINAGTLQLGDGTTDGTIASTSGVTNNGTLAYNWVNGHTAAYAISGMGIVTKAGAGALTLSGANSYAGGTTLNAGTLVAGSTTAFGASASALTINGGSLDSAVANLVLANNNAQNWNGDFTFVGTNNLNLGVGTVTLNANRQVTVSANMLTAGGAVSGTGFGLTKAGTGILFLAGINTYDGPTAVNAGTLIFNQGNAVSGTISVNGASLKGQNTVSNTGGALTAFGTSAINLNNGALLQLSENMSGFNRLYTVANSLNVSGTATVDAIATANSGQNYQFNALTLGSGSVLNISDSSNRFGGFGAVSTLLRGDATVTDQTGTNNAGGAMKLAAVAPDDSVTTGSVTTLTMNGTNPFAFINGAVTDNATNATKKLALTKEGTGTVTLYANNTYTGGTTINQGALNLSTNGTLGAATSPLSVNNTNSTGAGTAASLTLATAVDTAVGSLSGTIVAPVTGTNTATITTPAGRSFTVNQTTAGTYAGVIAGPGNFVLGAASTSKLILTGANTYTGNTTVKAGTLQASVAASGPLLNGSGFVDVQHGRLVLDYTGGSSPVAQIKTILDAGYTNNFSTSQIRSTTATPAIGLGYGDDGVEAVTVLATYYGDADLDGKVDFNDFLKLQTNYNVPGTRFDQGNFNYDGQTDFNDFLVLQTNFGSSVNGMNVSFTTEQVGIMNAFFAANTTDVPEPATLGLATAGVIIGLRRRNKR